MRQVAESIEMADVLSGVDVSPEEYTRLLGYPRGWVLEGRARELADWARRSAVALVNVDLRHSIAGNGSGIGHIYTYLCGIFCRHLSFA